MTVFHKYGMEDKGEILQWDESMLVEIALREPDDFLKIKETLTRIGISSEKTLYQSCHILHKHSRYFIVHFKELFVLDGKPSSITQNDVERRNTIIQLLADWGLLSVLKADKIAAKASVRQIKIIPFKEKTLWTLAPKYTIGKYKKHV